MRRLRARDVRRIAATRNRATEFSSAGEPIPEVSPRASVSALRDARSLMTITLSCGRPLGGENLNVAMPRRRCVIDHSARDRGSVVVVGSVEVSGDRG